MIKKGFFVLLMIMVTIGKGHTQEWNQTIKRVLRLKSKTLGSQSMEDFTILMSRQFRYR